jgi:hypothetical protein
MAELILEVQPVPNPTLLRVRAIWSPGGDQATWATLHWTVVPREFWPEGWLPPEDFRWQRGDYFPRAMNPFSQGKKNVR